MNKDAVISPDAKYRYWLARSWASEKDQILFIMLNPSTADSEKDDPTIRRCISFAQAWGFGCLGVVNLFAYRATNPRELWAASDPVGPENLAHIEAAACAADRIILAWGACKHPLVEPQGKKVIEIARGFQAKLYTLESEKIAHPLYQPGYLCELGPTIYTGGS